MSVARTGRSNDAADGHPTYIPLQPRRVPVRSRPPVGRPDDVLVFRDGSEAVHSDTDPHRYVAEPPPGARSPRPPITRSVDPRVVVGRPRSMWLIGAVTGLAAFALAWFVLVTLRLPSSSAATLDQLGLSVEAALARTAWYERVGSVLGWIVSVATTLSLGGVIFRVYIADDDRTHTVPTRTPTERALYVAAIAGVAAGLASVPFRAAAVSGNGLAAALDLDVIRFVLSSRFGDAALLRTAGLGIILLALAARPRTWSRPFAIVRPGLRFTGELDVDRRTQERAACLFGGFVILMSYALVGHPQATAPLLVAAQAVHVIAAATWFGGVAFLALELHHQRHHPSRHISAGVVHRFSTVAFSTVILAATTGTVLAASQLRSIGDLTGTGYGRALFLKLLILGAVLAIGGYNHREIVPAIARRHRPTAWRHLRRNLSRLRRTTTTEAVLIAMGILLATAAMVSGGF